MHAANNMVTSVLPSEMPERNALIKSLKLIITVIDIEFRRMLQFWEPSLEEH